MLAAERSVERNLPDRLVLLEPGATVVADDGTGLGTFRQLLTASTGVPTHLVFDETGVAGRAKAVPFDWVDSISADRVSLAAPGRLIEAIGEFDPTLVGPS